MQELQLGYTTNVTRSIGFAVMFYELGFNVQQMSKDAHAALLNVARDCLSAGENYTWPNVVWPIVDSDQNASPVIADI